MAGLGAANASAAAPQLITDTECVVDLSNSQDLDLDVECGVVVVEQKPGKVDAKLIELPFIRVKAPSQGGKAPLFLLAGGPGSTLLTPQAGALFQDQMLG